ncbi:MT-A70 family [Histoplasma capsulatum]|uniref:MT-A70 family n=1 Tax=Ajellomyces capsulatus TaxID=5037 RepID=A0A8A1M1V8_AJECA|nr:predicted protein [Histoplasma mississippiense (nom. inval.)]EDN03119.1 predicted protein [Histoplasma mississippiense (nom. inval.)]QSS58743.1 MT-A70 family [Histoplasma capsulatum]
MPESQNCRSAILYQNVSKTVILIDIPTSIAVAQQLKQPGSDEWGKDRGLSLLSCEPLQHPYPNPPEPKTEVARNRVLAQIPTSQQQFQKRITPIISKALQEIRERHHADWCYPRYSCLRKDVEEQNDGDFRKENEGISQPEPSGCPRKRKRCELDTESFGVTQKESSFIDEIELHSQDSCYFAPNEPPLILSQDINHVPGLAAIQGLMVQNPTAFQTVLNIKSQQQPCTTTGGRSAPEYISINIPPESSFINCRLTPPTESHPSPIRALSTDTKFNFILMDPPWPNRSVRRSSYYKEHAGPLQPIIEGVLQNHLHPHQALVAIWITNSIKSRSTTLNALGAAGLYPLEEWIWVKTTVDGQPAWPLDGLWRRPYEVLILAQREKPTPEDKQQNNKDESNSEFCGIKRRVIVAVPDIHSRKPNLKELIENIFFPSPTKARNGTPNGKEKYLSRTYSSLEVFARNLTAGWWACGDEVLRFNWTGWWTARERTENDV